MGLLEHIDILGDALGFSVVAHHFRWEVDQFAGVKPPTVGGEVIH